MDKMSGIRLENATRIYTMGESTVTAVDAIDLSIDHGEFVALWGPSGSGKSTLCNLVGLLDAPTSGSVLVDGQSVSSWSDDRVSEYRNRHMGFIFQQFNLIKVLSAVENVMMPLLFLGTGRRESREKAENMLRELGLASHGHYRPDKLSGGQQQRVAVARALVTGPSVIIADEPTANLDSENASQIVNLMKQMNNRRGTTFVFSTHDERLLAHVSRKIHLKDGRITEDVRDQ